MAHIGAWGHRCWGRGWGVALWRRAGRGLVHQRGRGAQQTAATVRNVCAAARARVAAPAPEVRRVGPMSAVAETAAQARAAPRRPAVPIAAVVAVVAAAAPGSGHEGPRRRALPVTPGAVPPSSPAATSAPLRRSRSVVTRPLGPQQLLLDGDLVGVVVVVLAPVQEGELRVALLLVLGHLLELWPVPRHEQGELVNYILYFHIIRWPRQIHDYGQITLVWKRKINK